MPPITKYSTLLRFVTCSAAIMACAVLFLFATQDRPLLAQQPLADFNVYTQTSITVTVILADGQRAVVPIMLDYSIEHRKGLGYVKMDAHVQQQPGLVLAVAESSYISASMEAVVYRVPLIPVVVAPPAPTIAPAVVIVAPTPLPTPLPPVVPTLVPPAIPTPAPAAATGLQYARICDVDESNMTDPQLTAHAAQFAGQTFTGWQGWVYDVVDRGDGSYNLEIAMEERGLIWTRDMVIENIPTDLATRLNVEQPLIFDGRIARVEYTFEVMCNPLVVDNFVLRQ